jgi:hypothetical protein
MRGRHWDALSKAMAPARVWPGDELTLSKLIKDGIEKHLDTLQVRCVCVCVCVWRE